MTFSPLAGNELRTRHDVANAARALFEPLVGCFSPGSARVRVSATGASFDETAAELEGFARPLWGLAALGAGSHAFGHWELIRAGIANGTDPRHPEFWGAAQPLDQRLVEMAAIGFALAMVPEQVWDPLPLRVRANLVQWLSAINEVEGYDNNWRLFRVLTNLGLKRVGAAHAPEKVEEACRRVDQFYVGNGWYRDGLRPQLDHYTAYTFHLYGLIYAQLQVGDDARAAVYRERAAQFALDYRHWFGPDGATVPFGRSLTYRFAPAAFWGALAFANVDALPWSEAKGLYLRHLRWWSTRPIADRAGVLTVGYGYPNLLISEEYNSPQSPYWAMKAFLPLAVEETHAFWTSDECAPLLPDRSVQPHAGVIVLRSPTHAVALSSGQSMRHHRQGAAKYGKFAYSSRFGFSVESHGGGLDRGVYDNMLAVARADDPEQFGVREAIDTAAISSDVIHSKWKPWHDVEVETWLIAIKLPWLLRIHRLVASRAVLTKEGGFAIARPREAENPPHPPRRSTHRSTRSIARAAPEASGIADLIGQRRAILLPALPNTNVIHPRTLVPMLLGRHKEGTHVLVTGVFATAEANEHQLWDAPPRVPDGPWFGVARVAPQPSSRLEP